MSWSDLPPGQFRLALAALGPDGACWHIGNLYTSLLLAKWRAAHGVFHRPPALAEQPYIQLILHRRATKE